MADRTATGRLRRLLALVPYVLAHQGQALTDVAQRFELNERELIDDLDLLWVCGLPGYSHLELIDVSYDSGELYIRNADVISAPMRLHRDEALSLMIGLQVIESLAEEEQRTALASLRAKISEATSDSVAAESSRIAVVSEENSLVGATVMDALTRQRRLLIDYFVPSRDEMTQREIDPIGLSAIDGQRYLIAWCRSAEGLRHFRLDRIAVAKIVDRPAAPPLAVPPTESAFTAPAGAPTARVKIPAHARWLIDYLSATQISETDDYAEIEIYVSDPDRIVALACQLGESMEILSPLDLRLAVHDRARSALSYYQ